MNPKDEAGAKKPGVSTFPMKVLFEAAAATKHGADKYGPFNWRDTPVQATAYFDAALRHLTAWFEGEDLDPDSGLPHLAHVIAGIAVFRDAQLHGSWIDDRPKTRPSPVDNDRPGW